MEMRAAALDGDLPALHEPLFVLGMDGHSAMAIAQNGKNAVVIRHQERSRRAAHEHFHAGAAGQTLKPPKVFDVFPRCTYEEGVIDPGASARTRQLVVEQSLGRGARLRVWHLENANNPAERGAGRAGRKIFLVLVSRLTEMNLRIDDPRKDVESADIDDCLGDCAIERAQCSNSSVSNADIRFHQTTRSCADAAPKNDLESIRHDLSFAAPRRQYSSCFQQLEGVTCAVNTSDVSLMPAGIKQERPLGHAAAFSRPRKKPLDATRRAEFPNALLARDERPDPLARARDPFCDGNRESTLATERLRFREMTREPSPQEPFTATLPQL